MNEVLNGIYEKSDYGEKWKCPRCGTTVARVVEQPSFQQRMEDATVDALAEIARENPEISLDEIRRLMPDDSPIFTKKTCVLILKHGYVFIESQDVWNEPINERPWMIGPQAREKRAFRRNRISRALTTGDRATVVYESHILKSGLTQKKKSDSEPIICAEDLARKPARIFCHKNGCKNIVVIRRVRES
jgi:hypothetical protein